MLVALIVLAIACAGLLSYTLILRSNISELSAEKREVETKLEVSNTSISALQTTITEQNTAVEKLKADAEARQVAAQAEIDKAKKLADQYKNRANTVINTPRPAGKTACEAAEDLINKEIRNASN